MKKLLIIALVAASAGLSAVDNSLTKAEAEEGWVLLFDGSTLFGWSPEAGTWRVDGGAIEAPPDGGRIRSSSAFADFQFHLEFRVPSGDADCGVLLRTALADPKSGYEVQIGDARADWPTGSVVDLAKARALRPEAAQWHAIDATVTGEHATVKLDGYSVADARNLRSTAGYVSLTCSKNPRVQFRNVRLKPLDMKALFNGTDLSGWKMVGAPPPEKVGVFGNIKKMWGGGDKLKDAAWTVADRMVHVEKGTGRLETAAAYDDFLFEATLRVNLKDRTELPKSAIFFRGDPGKLGTGYEVQSGSLGTLAAARKVAAPRPNEFFTETIAARGRHVQIWINGVTVVDYQDTRAEGNAPQKDARVAAGTIALESADEKTDIDYRGLRALQLPKTFGRAVVSLSEASIGSVSPLPPGTAVPTPVMGAPPDPTKVQIQQLMGQALAAQDPEQQAELYGRILSLDSTNQVAFAGHENAKQKIEEMHARQAQSAETKQREAEAEERKKTDGEAAYARAQESFAGGDYLTARTCLSTAERLMPNDARFGRLRQGIDRALATRARLQYALTGVGAIALIGGVVLFVRGRGPKTAYLEIVEGMDKGQRYTLDQEVTHIGAIAQDGGEKNEIVVRDMERMLSRFHCEVHARGKQVYVIDCGSANGTTVDKKRVQAGKAVPVKRGSRIDLAGTCVMRLGMQRKANG